MAVNADWMPTLAELCGIDLDTKDLDGKSLMPLIRDAEHESMHADGYCWQFKQMWVARKGKWKLLGNPYDTSERDFRFETDRFLVDLESDPGERNNLAGRHPEIVKELEAMYKLWLRNSKPE